MLMILFLSIAGFGFYRIYFGLMLIKRKKDNYIFYGKETELPKRLKETLDERDKWQKDVCPHLIPGIIWIIVTLVLLPVI